VSINPIRLFGAAIMVVGLWIALQVVSSAWSTIERPQRLAALAAGVDEATHLNAFVDHFNQRLNALTAGVPGAAEPAPPRQPVTAAYFAGLAVYIGLLLVAAKVGLWTLAEGAKVAAARADDRRDLAAVIRELIKETKSGERDKVR